MSKTNPVSRLFYLALVASILAACDRDSGPVEKHPAPVGQVPEPGGIHQDQLTATELVPLLQSGKLTVGGYMRRRLELTRKYDGTLNTFITVEEEGVMQSAGEADALRESGAELGPLFGVPISLKDLVITRGLETTFGTAKFAGFIPERNAPLVDKLEQAGAIIFGKNNNQELAFGSNGYNSHYGQQLNPYDVTRIAGGSTGGGAAAVAARMVPIAIGSDTAASIRVPAAFTGLYGFRPSTGRYDNTGVSPIAPTLDTVGPLTRSVADLVLIDSVLAEDFSELPAIDLKDLRLGVPGAYFHEGVGSETMAAFQAFLKRLEAAGVTLIEADLPRAKALTDGGLYPILFYETWPSMTRFLEQWGDGTTIEELHATLGWDVKAMWDQMVIPGAPEAIPEEAYRAAINDIRPELQENYRRYFEEHGAAAIIFPATASAAPLAAPDNPQETVIDGNTVSIYINDHNSSPGALAGQPGVVLPLVMNSRGLPLGVSLDGKRHQDRELLAIAGALNALLEPLPAPRLP